MKTGEREYVVPRQQGQVVTLIATCVVKPLNQDSVPLLRSPRRSSIFAYSGKCGLVFVFVPEGLQPLDGG